MMILDEILRFCLAEKCLSAVVFAVVLNCPQCLTSGIGRQEPTNEAMWSTHTFLCSHESYLSNKPIYDPVALLVPEI